jgi:acyl carrier protein
MSGAGEVDRAPLRNHFIAIIGGDAKLLPADSESLVDEGILDSFGLAELVALIERSYGVKVPDADLALANFESIDKIAAWIVAARR